MPDRAGGEQDTSSSSSCSHEVFLRQQIAPQSSVPLLSSLFFSLPLSLSSSLSVLFPFPFSSLSSSLSLPLHVPFQFPFSFPSLLFFHARALPHPPSTHTSLDYVATSCTSHTAFVLCMHACMHACMYARRDRAHMHAGEREGRRGRG